MMRQSCRILFLTLLVLVIGGITMLPASATEYANNERELREAIVNSNHEDDIVIGARITLTAPIIIPENKKLTLSRGALAWSDSADPRLENMILVENNARLTLKSISINGKGSVGLLYVNSGGELVLEQGATLRGGYAQTAGGIYNKGLVTINNGVITECEAVNGGAIYNWGKIIMNSGAIYENVAEKDGGGIYNLGTFSMKGGRLYDNKAETGAGLYQHKDATHFEVSGTPAIADGLFLGKKQTVHVSTELLNRSASLVIEGIEDTRQERIVVNNLHRDMQDDYIWAFNIKKGYPWKLVRFSDKYVLEPDDERPGE